MSPIETWTIRRVASGATMMDGRDFWVNSLHSSLNLPSTVLCYIVSVFCCCSDLAMIFICSKSVWPLSPENEAKGYKKENFNPGKSNGILFHFQKFNFTPKDSD